MTSIMTLDILMCITLITYNTNERNNMMYFFFFFFGKLGAKVCILNQKVTTPQLKLQVRKSTIPPKLQKEVSKNDSGIGLHHIKHHKPYQLESEKNPKQQRKPNEKPVSKTQEKSYNPHNFSQNFQNQLLGCQKTIQRRIV